MPSLDTTRAFIQARLRPCGLADSACPPLLERRPTLARTQRCIGPGRCRLSTAELACCTHTLFRYSTGAVRILNAVAVARVRNRASLRCLAGRHRARKSSSHTKGQKSQSGALGVVERRTTMMLRSRMKSLIQGKYTGGVQIKCRTSAQRHC